VTIDLPWYIDLEVFLCCGSFPIRSLGIEAKNRHSKQTNTQHVFGLEGGKASHACKVCRVLARISSENGAGGIERGLEAKEKPIKPLRILAV
jgi:hypothetical protein